VRLVVVARTRPKGGVGTAVSRSSAPVSDAAVSR
jgi:hypothetical protein